MSNTKCETEEMAKSINNNSLEELIKIKEYATRKIYLTEEIDSDKNTNDIIKKILTYNRADADIKPKDREPIFIYISCKGGSVASGLELIDAIELSQTPVYTIVTGMCYSMALYVFLAGHERVCFPHSSFLIHDGSVDYANSSLKASDLMQFYSATDDMLYKLKENSNYEVNEYPLNLF